MTACHSLSAFCLRYHGPVWRSRKSVTSVASQYVITSSSLRPSIPQAASAGARSACACGDEISCRACTQSRAMSYGALPLFPAKSNLSLSPLQPRPELSITKVARNESVKRQQTQSPTHSASKHFAMLSRGLPNLLERARAVTANVDATEAAAEERPMWREKISLDQEDLEHPLARVFSIWILKYRSVLCMSHVASFVSQSQRPKSKGSPNEL